MGVREAGQRMANDPLLLRDRTRFTLAWGLFQTRAPDVFRGGVAPHDANESSPRTRISLTTILISLTTILI
jgi:hypothetical protein